MYPLIDNEDLDFNNMKTLIYRVCMLALAFLASVFISTMFVIIYFGWDFIFINEMDAVNIIAIIVWSIAMFIECKRRR